MSWERHGHAPERVLERDILTLAAMNSAATGEHEAGFDRGHPGSYALAAASQAPSEGRHTCRQALSDRLRRAASCSAPLGLAAFMRRDGGEFV